MLSVLGFADDTNILCRKFDASKVEEITDCWRLARSRPLARRSEWLRECVMTNCREGFSAAVRFLGPWIDMNGGCVTDTAMRLERAREVLAQSQSQTACARRWFCGRKREFFRRPSLRHSCSEHCRDVLRYGDGYEANSPSRTRKYDENEEEGVRKGGRRMRQRREAGQSASWKGWCTRRDNEEKFDRGAPRNCSRRDDGFRHEELHDDINGGLGRREDVPVLP